MLKILLFLHSLVSSVLKAPNIPTNLLNTKLSFFAETASSCQQPKKFRCQTRYAPKTHLFLQIYKTSNLNTN